MSHLKLEKIATKMVFKICQNNTYDKKSILIHGRIKISIETISKVCQENLELLAQTNDC